MQPFELRNDNRMLGFAWDDQANEPDEDQYPAFEQSLLSSRSEIRIKNRSMLRSHLRRIKKRIDDAADRLDALEEERERLVQSGMDEVELDVLDGQLLPHRRVGVEAVLQLTTDSELAELDEERRRLNREHGILTRREAHFSKLYSRLTAMEEAAEVDTRKGVKSPVSAWPQEAHRWPANAALALNLLEDDRKLPPEKRAIKRVADLKHRLEGWTGTEDSIRQIRDGMRLVGITSSWGRISVYLDTLREWERQVTREGKGHRLKEALQGLKVE